MIVKEKKYGIIYFILCVLFYILTTFYLRQTLRFRIVSSKIHLILAVVYFLSAFFLSVFDLDKDKLTISIFVRAFFVNLIFIFVFSFLTFYRRKAFNLFMLQFVFQIVLRYVFVKSFRSDLFILNIVNSKKEGEIEFKQIYKGMKKYILKKNIVLSNDKDKEYIKFKKDPILYLKTHQINMIVIQDYDITPEIEDVLLEAKFEGIEIIKFSDLYEKIEGQVFLENLNHRWFIFDINYSSLTSDFYKKLKRVMDISISLVMLILTFPFIVIFIILIKIESPGQALFVQDRIGQNNKTFKMFKLRSMKIHDENKHPVYAGEHDTRITKIGHFIRKTRSDELPQLINVLRGDMSFVGPRAEWTKIYDQYAAQIEFYDIRYLVKPGLTGWAQVSYPYAIDLEDAKNKFKYDLYYLKHANIWLDLAIIIKTFRIVFGFKGR